MPNEIDPDTSATIPMMLRADARGAIAARDAIDDCFLQEWADAHEAALGRHS